MRSKKIFFMITIVFFLSSCSFETEYKEYIINDLSKPMSDTLIYITDDYITTVEMIIKGNIKGKGILEFENGGDRFIKIYLEDTINKINEMEWYEPKIFFRYIPNGNVSGDSLVITYRMF